MKVSCEYSLIDAIRGLGDAFPIDVRLGVQMRSGAGGKVGLHAVTVDRAVKPASVSGAKS